MQPSKSHILVIVVLGMLLCYQVFSAINTDKAEPFPYNDTEVGQIRPGVYQR